jgi:quinol monooxygenase YgiN
MPKTPVDVLCIYRVKKGKEAAFRKLLKLHGPTLKKAGLSGKAPKVWRASSERQPGIIFVELMQWKDQNSSAAAHQSPEVMAVWEPMGNLADGMEFLEIEPEELG